MCLSRVVVLGVPWAAAIAIVYSDRTDLYERTRLDEYLNFPKRVIRTMCGFSGNVEALRAPLRRSVCEAGRIRRAERTNVFANIWYSTGHMRICNSKL
jgi:hypothetical protein